MEHLEVKTVLIFEKCQEYINSLMKEQRGKWQSLQMQGINDYNFMIFANKYSAFTGLSVSVPQKEQWRGLVEILYKFCSIYDIFLLYGKTISEYEDF